MKFNKNDLLVIIWQWLEDNYTVNLPRPAHGDLVERLAKYIESLEKKDGRSS